jgi:hypothetical protein
VEAFGRFCGTGRKVVGNFVVVLFVIAVGGDDVVICRYAVEAMDFRAFFRGQAGHVLVVVVGVVPDGARWFDVGVDEVLVVCFWVMLSYPPVGEWPAFVFHASSRLCRDAIFLSERVF